MARPTTREPTGTPSHNGAESRTDDDTRDDKDRHLDPMYDVPLVGRLVREADQMRLKLPFGSSVAGTEASLLRAEARALRLAANYLEARARQLERMSSPSRAGGEGKRLQRIKLD